MSTLEAKEFSELFVKAIIHTLKIQCGVHVEHGGTFKKEPSQGLFFDVGALIGVTSPNLKGSAALCLSKPVFIYILESLIKEKVEDITQDNEDAVAELLNIAFSNVKNFLNRQGHALQMAIPTTIRGTHIEAHYSKHETVSVLQFKTEKGNFHVELLYKASSVDLDAREKNSEASPSQSIPSSLGSSQIESLPAAEEQPITATSHQSSSKKEPLSAAQMAAFFSPFVSGAILTLKVQCELTQVKPGKLYDKTPQNAPSFDIAGIVGITSQTVNGSFLLAFKKDVFLKLTNRVFQENHTSLQPGAEELAAELVNMILGAAKRALNDEGKHKVEMAIPTVLQGQDVYSSLPKGRRIIVIPFQSEIGDFHVEIDIRI